MSEIGIVSGNLYYSVSLYFLRIILTGIVILLDIHFKECPLNSKISYGIFFLGKLNITNPILLSQISNFILGNIFLVIHNDNDMIVETKLKNILIHHIGVMVPQEKIAVQNSIVQLLRCAVNFHVSTFFIQQLQNNTVFEIFVMPSLICSYQFICPNWTLVIILIDEFKNFAALKYI